MFLWIKITEIVFKKKSKHLVGRPIATYPMKADFPTPVVPCNKIAVDAQSCPPITCNAESSEMLDDVRMS
jgi:hypothetical protein